MYVFAGEHFVEAACWASSRQGRRSAESVADGVLLEAWQTDGDEFNARVLRRWSRMNEAIPQSTLALE